MDTSGVNLLSQPSSRRQTSVFFQNILLLSGKKEFFMRPTHAARSSNRALLLLQNANLILLLPTQPHSLSWPNILLLPHSLFFKCSPPPPPPFVHVITCDLLCSPLTPCLSLSPFPAVSAGKGLETSGGWEWGRGGAPRGSSPEGPQGFGGAAGAPGGATC